MKVLSAADVAKLAPYKDLVAALREGFRSAITTPVRHHHETGPATTLLLMPAWAKDWTGLKTVTVKTDNAAQDLPTVQGSYLLIDNKTGAPVCMMDGTELTRRRTAAASALASDISRARAPMRWPYLGQGHSPGILFWRTRRSAPLNLSIS